MKKPSILLIAAGALGVYLLSKNTNQNAFNAQQAVATDATVPRAVAGNILAADSASSALAIGIDWLSQNNTVYAVTAASPNNITSPFAPNSPDFTTPQAYTPNPNAPTAYSQTIDPKNYTNYEDFFAAWFPTVFTKEWQDKYYGVGQGVTGYQLDMIMQQAADYRHSLYNTAGDIWNTSRRTGTL